MFVAGLYFFVTIGLVLYMEAYEQRRPKGPLGLRMNSALALAGSAMTAIGLYLIFLSMTPQSHQWFATGICLITALIATLINYIKCVFIYVFPRLLVIGKKSFGITPTKPASKTNTSA